MAKSKATPKATPKAPEPYRAQRQIPSDMLHSWKIAKDLMVHQWGQLGRVGQKSRKRERTAFIEQFREPLDRLLDGKTALYMRVLDHLLEN